MTPSVRPAEPRDAEAIGAAHVAAWQARYRGLMPDAYLDGLDPTARATMWAEALSGPPPVPGGIRLVATSQDGAVVGFAVAGPEDGDAAATRGQLYAVNVHPQAWGQGHGGRLLTAVDDHLAGLGFTEAVLWVHPGNHQARAVYAHMGWRPDGAAKGEDVDGVTVPVIRMVHRLP